MNDGLVPRDDIDRRTATTLSPDEHLLVRRGDIAYNMMRMWQGACGLAEHDGIVSPSYVVVVPNERIDARFAYHWFKSARGLYLLWAYSHGLTDDRLRLYFDDFCQVPFIAPSIKVQRRIADLLDAWDRAIEAAEVVVAAKRLRKNALLSEIIPIRSRRRAAHVKKVRLGDLGSFVRGVGYDPARDVTLDRNIGTAILTATNVQDDDLLFTGAETLVGATRCKPEQLVRRGDYVLSMSNGSRDLVGKAGFCRDVPYAAAAGAFCGTFRPNSPANRLLVGQIFRSPAYREQLHIALAGSSINNLTESHFSEFEFACAPVELERLTNLDLELSLVKMQISHLRRQKRGLVQGLLTDERHFNHLDLPGEAAA